MPLWLDLWIEEVEAPAHKDSLDRWLKNCTGAGSVSTRSKHPQRGSTERSPGKQKIGTEEKKRSTAIKKFRSPVVYRSIAEVSISQSQHLLSRLVLARSRSLPTKARSPSFESPILVFVRSVRHGKPSDSLGVVQFSISLVFRSLAFCSVSLRH